MTPDTPSTEARDWPPATIDEMAAIQRSDTPSTEALTPLERDAFIMVTNNAGRHDVSCRWSRMGLIDYTPCTCGLFDDIAEIIAWSRQKAADTSGLRAALRDILAIVQETSQSLPSRDRHAVEQIALAALRGATERPLDVERLARVICAEAESVESYPQDFDECIDRNDHLDYAALIATEYARLASPTTTTPEDKP